MFAGIKRDNASKTPSMPVVGVQEMVELSPLSYLHSTLTHPFLNVYIYFRMTLLHISLL